MTDLHQIRYSSAQFKKARVEAGLTQTEVAEAVGVEKAAVSKYEIGAGLPSAEVLAKLCALYGVSLTFFLEEAA